MIGYTYLAKWRKGDLEVEQEGKFLPKLRAVPHLALWTEGMLAEKKPLLPVILLASGPKLA